MTGSSGFGFDKVLVANRGEIAVRILATVRRLGLGSVAVFSEADAAAPHVLAADDAVCIGPAPTSASYLDADRILDAALHHGASAVHPGYGLLSENAAFAAACEEAGLAFVGPTPEQIRVFGSKPAARALAAEHGVPLAAGTGVVDDLDVALAEAARIGYPVMVKAGAGGGGIGMRACADEAALVEAFESVRRLAQASFGDGSVFLERVIRRARHVEVQVLGDGAGRIVTFPERDCSLQRRHQKVVEETPAPDLPDAIRERLAAHARALLAPVAYRSAGTAEFLVDADTGEAAFLEVNTRLQVEHGVTELVTSVDLVEEMLRIAAGADLAHLPDAVPATGHAVEARVYAEDPAEAFRPSSGLLTRVELPATEGAMRVDGWVATGTEVTPFYDPLLAKVMAWADDRAGAVRLLSKGLATSAVDGVETNLGYLVEALAAPDFLRGAPTTATLDGVAWCPPSVVVEDPGPATSVQDLPGRLGLWHVGVPPSGPMDDRSFRLVNELVGNPPEAAGLEMTQRGATLRFRTPTVLALGGAELEADLGGRPVPWWTPVAVAAGEVLRLGDRTGPGCRTYLAVAGAIDVPVHLGSRATFALGGFGGHAGRLLRSGDVLHIGPATGGAPAPPLPVGERPVLTDRWDIGVLSGPQGAPDFLTADGIDAFLATEWEVHYHSDRTGVRLLGPAPGWARADGGEAGLHPSNLHDNPYAVGTVDLTGDMPIILGPDGPSCGGFVCPFTVALAERWKLGQVVAGDRIRFVPITDAEARGGGPLPARPAAVEDPVLHRRPAGADRPELVCRRDGDANVLLEYGPHELDLGLRLRVGALVDRLGADRPVGVEEMIPGVRSLQLRFDPARTSAARLTDAVLALDDDLPSDHDLVVPSRVVHLPLSWDDPDARKAMEIYSRVVRPDAPWCPSNIEFIRRINGLADEDEVRRIVFDASYLVLALGDVYLGAPVATPIDPRHRLVTTKYNPARTWTAENSVGIGGAYLCIYGMEGPGGYQLVGRTIQMWNRWRPAAGSSDPWLLRTFDQIRFHPVSHEELARLRAEVALGRYELQTEDTTFALADHRRFLADEADSIRAFTERREAAFAEERARWEAAGVDVVSAAPAAPRDLGAEAPVPEGHHAVLSPMAGALVSTVEVGTEVATGDTVAVIEAMKTETAVVADREGRVVEVRAAPGEILSAGTIVAVLG